MMKLKKGYKLLTLLLVLGISMSVVACGANKADDSANGATDTTDSKDLVTTEAGDTTNDNSASTDASEAGADASQIINKYWDGVSEKFSIIGGDLYSNVMDQGAAFNLESENAKDTLVGTFMLPEDVIPNITDIATITHMMNSNELACVVVKVDGVSEADLIEAIKDNVRNAEFMCGAPEKFYIGTTGGYVIYAYGNEGNIDELSTIVSAFAEEQFISQLPY